MKLENIRRPKGARRPKKRVGRGSGSGHGKTSGRGHKGAKSRAGASRRLGFEGGQMPLIRRLPKRGFNIYKKSKYQIINVESLNCFKKDTAVDKASLEKAGFIKKVSTPVKILGEGKLTKALSVKAEAFSKSAKKKITDAGGKTEALKKG